MSQTYGNTFFQRRRWSATCCRDGRKSWKSFDTVDHPILLEKLQYYGFRGIINDWFKSYLTNRTLTTQIGAHISRNASITCGVPQGSVLGPLMFLLYINDIQNCSDKFQFFLFADDTNLLYADKDLSSQERTVNRELKGLCRWLSSNKLTLNTPKSNFVIFCPRQKKSHSQASNKYTWYCFE